MKHHRGGGGGWGWPEGADYTYSMTLYKIYIIWCIWEKMTCDRDALVKTIWRVMLGKNWHAQLWSEQRSKVILIRHQLCNFKLLGTRQLFSFATTTMRQPNRATGTRKHSKNIKVSVFAAVLTPSSGILEGKVCTYSWRPLSSWSVWRS